jgi:peptidylprolyl isomerase|tara:strand:+ start:527 stop:1255 length:729 start_codon:yes stop_codon:yes gene_type:complete
LTFKKGQLILLDYTAKIKDSGEIFETTIEDEAKKHSLHDPNVKYMPKLVSIGEAWVLKGLDDALSETTTGDKKTIEVSPDKGFGERDKGKVRMIPLRKLGEDAEKVSVGDTVEIDNKKGIIRYIGSGRVQIDYNHRYAGKTILYDINVKKSLDSEDDRISEILKSRIPVENEKIIYKKTGTVVDITIPEEIFRADGLAIIKHFTQTDLFKFVSSLTKVNFIETYENKKQPSKPKSTEKPKSE